MTHKQEHHHGSEHHKQEHALAHDVVIELKHDVEALKKKLSQPDPKSHELILEIESLKDAVHKLNVIFEKALKETKEEDLFKTFQTMQDKLDHLINQNETIAQGMLALSDKLDNAVGRPMARMPGMPVQHAMGAPSLSGRTAPRPEMSMPSMHQAPSETAGFPPPPPGPASRKGRVGLFS